jgi:hypothetical protein
MVFAQLDNKNIHDVIFVGCIASGVRLKIMALKVTVN